MSLKIIFGTLIMIFGFFLTAQAEENGLPWESDLTKLKLNKISIGNEIDLFTIAAKKTPRFRVLFRGFRAFPGAMLNLKVKRRWILTPKPSFTDFS